MLLPRFRLQEPQLKLDDTAAGQAIARTVGATVRAMDLVSPGRPVALEALLLAVAFTVEVNQRVGLGLDVLA